MTDAEETNVVVDALENDASRFAHIRDRLVAFREMNDTQRADFANWVWLCECESRAAVDKAREENARRDAALAEAGSRIGRLEAQVGAAEDALGRVERIARIAREAA